MAMLGAVEIDDYDAEYGLVVLRDTSRGAGDEQEFPAVERASDEAPGILEEMTIGDLPSGTFANAGQGWLHASIGAN